jgi:hypothetical protein
LKVERKGEEKGFNAENTEDAEFEEKRRGTVTPRPDRGRRRSQREEHRGHREKKSERVKE